jgi:predicted transcriptional regulator of viral defense system
MELSARKYKATLGGRGALPVRASAEEGKAVFTLDDASRVLGSGAERTLHDLARKRRILPLRRGLYAIVPLDVGIKGGDAFVVHNFAIASRLVAPYCVACWSALNHFGLAEQIPRTTFIATTRARNPVKGGRNSRAAHRRSPGPAAVAGLLGLP